MNRDNSTAWGYNHVTVDPSARKILALRSSLSHINKDLDTVFLMYILYLPKFGGSLTRNENFSDLSCREVITLAREWKLH